MEPNGTPTAKQQRLIAALLASPTTGAALAAAGVGAATLSRWRREPAFVDALSAARSTLFADGYARLLGEQARNLEELARLRDDGENENTRLRAAIALEQSLVKRYELLSLSDLERRIAALEGGTA